MGRVIRKNPEGKLVCKTKRLISEAEDRKAMKEKKKRTAFDASVGSFVAATIIIFIMMILTYMLTFMVPGGGIPFWKWALSPILVLFGEDRTSLIAIIALLVILGGTFNCLDKFGVLKFLLDRITEKFGKNRKMQP